MDGVPTLFHPESPFYPRGGGIPAGADPRRPAAARWLARVRAYHPPMTLWTDLTLFERLNEAPPGAAILNLGSGVGAFDRFLRPGLTMTNLDVAPMPGVDVLADGHYLPFPDASLDGVFSNAVLEHVQRPWVVAEEIRRVLRPGGVVYVNVPFLNVIHAKHDYFRFTDRGLAMLFDGFETVAAGVSAAGGSFLGPFLVEYLLCFVPGRVARAAARRLFYLAATPLRYLDLVAHRSALARVTADAFYFVGRKPADSALPGVVTIGPPQEAPQPL